MVQETIAMEKVDAQEMTFVLQILMEEMQEMHVKPVLNVKERAYVRINFVMDRIFADKWESKTMARKIHWDLKN